MTAEPFLDPPDEYNTQLLAQVHPPDWVNPEPTGRYNLVVIGGGTAGLVSAAGAAGLGARAALIERQLLGGDCLNVGCVPSKSLIRASRAVHEARNSARFGVRGGEHLEADFAVAMERLRRLRADIGHHDSALRFRDQLGVDVFLGQGSFTGPDRIEVAGKTLTFDRAAICTGARAAIPAIAGLTEAGCLTNETLFSLTSLPPRLAVLGGGPIGCEMAQAFARFGSRVTLINHGPRLLGRADADAGAILHQVFVREGISLHLETRVLAVRVEDGEKILQLEQYGQKRELRVDAILVAAGRTANVEGLGLDLAGVAFDRAGVRVDDQLRTSNSRIFAAGDICSTHQFTHTADAQARILIANSLFHGRQRTSALTIPWCIYTDPEVAQVGLNEAEAERQGIAVTTLTVPLAEVDRAVLDGESEGFARVHLRRGSDRIVGATLVARHAGETISELTLATAGGLGLSAIGRTIHPYPTQAEALKKLADAYNRTRLTPTVKTILSGWLRWRRRA